MCDSVSGKMKNKKPNRKPNRVMCDVCDVLHEKIIAPVCSGEDR